MTRPSTAPCANRSRALVAATRKLQSGRLDAYITYMLITLVAVIALVVAVA